MKTVEDIKSLQAQAILRLNCPGIGQSFSLAEGDARPLTEYKVIIVNPVSIVHLFGEDPALSRQIDMALAEGLTSFRLSDDTVIEKIGQQIELRSPELFRFLAEGGLLIYFLSRPFIVTDDIRSMDNYAWLCGLAPDQSGESTMSEQTVRHMSSVAHGRNIDRVSASHYSKFDKYFDQVGLEWNTIIRTDFLTSGYTALALAGPKKCIAGELIAGDNGGRVVFLPAPYSPDFERTLMGCINNWYADKMGLAEDSSETGETQTSNDAEIENGEIKDIRSGEIVTEQSRRDKEKSTVAAIVSQQVAEQRSAQTSAQTSAKISESKNPPVPNRSMPKAKEVGAKIPEQPLGEETGEENGSVANTAAQIADKAAARVLAKTASVLDEKTIEERVAEKLANRGNPSNLNSTNDQFTKTVEHQKITSEINKGNDNSSVAHPADEQLTDNKIEPLDEENLPVFNAETVTDWAKSYWLPGVDGLIKEIQVIRKQIRDLERKLTSNENTISSLEGVKTSLLAGGPGDLLASCKVVLDDLGWSVELKERNSQEIVLMDSGNPVAVARVAVSKGSSERTELARLTETLINFWDSHGSEPKGILVACTFTDIPVARRKEPDFPEVMIDFARRKNICLIATTQLVSIYLALKLGKIQPETVREAILSTSGNLAGFAL